MALSSNALASLIQNNLSSQGAKGSNLQKFCTAIAKGIVMSIVGKSFVTFDVGLTPGVGAGIGTGITGLSPSSMKATALSFMNTKGKNADPLMDAIMSATVSHLSTNASLSSVDSPVYLGTGTITVGTISVVASEMTSNIDSQLESSGAKGSNRTNLARAIANGICSDILSSGSGTLVITGSAPSSPTPGTGTGSGIVS